MRQRDHSTPASPGHPRTTSRRWPLLALLSVVALLAWACSSDDSGHEASDTAQGLSAAEDAASSPVEGREVGLADGEELAQEDARAQATAAAQPEGAADAGEADGAEPPDGATGQPADGTAATGERIIKEGTVTLQVEPGDFDTAFGQVVARAQALGGHVAGTSSSTTPGDGPDDPGLTSGQVTIRVPVRNFEDLLTSLGQAGEITDCAITSQDVTAEYTDLESRRRNLEAQERFYLGLLEQATGIQDAIAVQQQLDDVTAQIEQITGRLNLLADRSAFSTLTVRIAERGAAPAEASGEEPSGLMPYVRDAGDTLVATVGSLLVVLTFLLPFLVLAGIGYATWRAVRRRRPATPAGDATTPAAAPLVTSGAPAGADDPDRG